MRGFNYFCSHSSVDPTARGTCRGILDAGYAAIEALSMEKGYRHWHADVRPDDSPLEAGLGFAVPAPAGRGGSAAPEGAAPAAIALARRACRAFSPPRRPRG